jgi:hypothetical protein
MVETEMSLQTDLISLNDISNYKKIEQKEVQNDNQLDINVKNSNISNERIIHPVNSDSLLQKTKNNKDYFYKKLGNTFSFFGDSNGYPLIIIGPHWYLFLSVIFYFTLGYIAIHIFFGNYISFFMKIITFIIYLLFLSSFLYTGLINPGYPNNDINNIDFIEGKPKKCFYYCTICKLWVNEKKKVRHCKYCNICVEGMDHHCPWTGKCIGARNIISFYIFVFSIFLLIVDFSFIIINTRRKSPK